MHYLILFPYYFFTALTLTAFFTVIVRLLRLDVTINAIVMVAVFSSLLLLIAALASDSLSVSDLRGGPMMVLAALSFIFAGIDAMLKQSLPHSLDDELSNHD